MKILSSFFILSHIPASRVPTSRRAPSRIEPQTADDIKSIVKDDISVRREKEKKCKREKRRKM